MAAGSRNERRGRRLLVIGRLVVSLGAGLLVGGLVWMVAWMIPAETWDLRDLLWPEIVALVGVLLVIAGVRLRARGIRESRLCPATFFTGREEATVIEAIRQAELTTSAEIRVHLHDHVGNVMEEAKQTFEELGMTATEQKNGVLFFISTRDRRLAILGDSGIDDHVEAGYWQTMVNRVENAFSSGGYAAGLTAAIEDVAKRMGQHFPRLESDVNELPDDISRS